MSLVVDTSLLVRRLDTSSAQHPIAIQSLERLAQGGEAMSVVPQNLYEFWVVSTRPVAVRRDSPDLYDRWAQIVTAHDVSGKPAHDARIVAAMLAHGITRILTFNGSDFARFAALGIVVVDPATV